MSRLFGRRRHRPIYDWTAEELQICRIWGGMY
jgi:hypothetical protein